MKQVTRGALWLGFIIYVAILIQFVLLKDMNVQSALGNIFERERPSEWTRHNFNLFETIGLYWNDSRIHWTVRLSNLGGNVLGFMPFGLLLPLLFRRKPYFVLTVIYGFLFSLALETLQWFMVVGSFDVDDLFLNTIGVAAGYLLFRVIHFFLPVRTYLYGQTKKPRSA